MSTESERGYAELLTLLPAATSAPSECRHLKFAAHVAVARLEDTFRFVAEVRVICVECHEPFRFQGLAPGVFHARPSCSIDGLEALLPIEPELVPKLFSGARYEMPPQETQH